MTLALATCHVGGGITWYLTGHAVVTGSCRKRLMYAIYMSVGSAAAVTDASICRLLER